MLQGEMMDYKKKILLVNEASPLRTGFSNYGYNILKRLYATNKYEITEFASYLSQNDPRWRTARPDIKWRYIGNLPKLIRNSEGKIVEDPEEAKIYYKDYKYNQFGKWKFDSVVNSFRPDIVLALRDRWMDYW